MPVIPWSQPGWLDEAHAWIHAELARLNQGVVGVIEQPHTRPWSTILRVPTDRGTVYFKAVGSDAAHEVPLTVALARGWPNYSLSVLAADTERGWLLLPDGGPTLRSLIREDKDTSRWETVLSVYADLQVAMAERVHDLLRMGVPDRRLDRLPALYEGLLADTDMLRVDRPNGLTTDEYRRLQALAPRFTTLSQELAAFGLPETLHHGDFHDANVFWQDGRPVFFDWGDSVISHPFFSLRTVLVSLEMSLGDEAAAGQAFTHLLDAYLEPWTPYVPLAELKKARRLAYLVGVVNGALTWHSQVAALDAAGRQEYGGPVPALLQEFLGEVEGTTAYSWIGS